ncbi:MAG: exo-beta-N-acetylmuramidase NamZ domain-containing protein [Kiritimatiellia bacterium]
MGVFRPGIDVLLGRRRRLLPSGARVGLVSHLAAVDRLGATTAERLWLCRDCRLAALFGPEHGFVGAAGAGDRVGHSRHPVWDVPVFSLYGASQRPAPAQLRGLDVLVFDLQDLGARPYTYVSTLRGVLEAAATAGLPVIVADRPIPLPHTVDGPMPDGSCDSFVCAVPAPMAYCMTPGETALWLRNKLGLNSDVRVAPMSGYHRQPGRDVDWPPWLPPSPGIRSWETARCYLTTVFGEALPAVDTGRGTNLIFQVFGAPWMQSMPALEWLCRQRLPGVMFYAHPYQSASTGRLLDGIRIVVQNPRIFRPVTTSIAILECLQRLYGAARIWRAKGARPDFFDKLYGSSLPRIQLQQGGDWKTISAGWRVGLRRFNAERREFLLY